MSHSSVSIFLDQLLQDTQKPRVWERIRLPQSPITRGLGTLEAYCLETLIIPAYVHSRSQSPLSGGGD